MRSRLPLFKTSNIHLSSSPTQVCAPNSTKPSSLSPKIEKSGSPILSSIKLYVGQKLKYTYNLSIVVDGVAVLSFHKNTSEDSTCGFHYTIQKYNGSYSTQPRRQFIFKNALQALLICHQTSITFSPQATSPIHLSEIFSSTVQSMDTASL